MRSSSGMSSPILKASAPSSRLGSSSATPLRYSGWISPIDRTNTTGRGRSTRRAHRRSPPIPPYDGTSSGKELSRDAKVYHLDSDDESVDDEDEGRRHGGLGIRDGMSKIGAFFSNFTAPKGEGMGNPGPTSHPHLFPSHQRNEGEEPRRSPTSTRSMRREPTRDDEMESLSLPPASASSPPSPEDSFSRRSTGRGLVNHQLRRLG